MKWTYKKCDVEITPTLVLPAMASFTPVAEVDCKPLGIHRLIATAMSFPNPALAEQHGAKLAREWIDRNLAPRA